MKEKIVKQFLEEGILLSPDTLGKITENNVERMLERAKREKAVVFSFQDEKPELMADVMKLQKRVKLSPQDFAGYYNNRFEGLRGMLQKKMEDVVSVANAKKSGSTITTIGMMREQTQRGFIMEDTTGWVEVITKAEDVVADDVIAVKGGVKEEKLFAEEIIWPDVPMSHSRNRPDISIILAEKDGHEGEFVITPDAIYGFDKKKTTLPNPGWITISKDSLAMTVLVYKPDKPATQKEVLAWLRKRHLCPDKNQIRGTDDPFLIEPIPDVVWIISSELWSDNYKGIIVVSSDGKVPAEVSLATGHVEFKD
jgi:DNA polymerase II small subunit/DNA polymerase delta subunit B